MSEHLLKELLWTWHKLVHSVCWQDGRVTTHTCTIFFTNTTPVSQTQTHFKSLMCCVCACNSSDSYSNSGNQGYFVTEHAGMLFQMLFLRRTQARMAFWNLLFLVLVWLTPPSPTKFCVTICCRNFFGLLSKNESRLIYKITSLSACTRMCVCPTNNFWTAW
jgi:hypothetical protein